MGIILLGFLVFIILVGVRFHSHLREEIDHLRLQVRELESIVRRLEQQLRSSAIAKSEREQPAETDYLLWEQEQPPFEPEILQPPLRPRVAVPREKSPVQPKPPPPSQAAAGKIEQDRPREDLVPTTLTQFRAAKQSAEEPPKAPPPPTAVARAGFPEAKPSLEALIGGKWSLRIGLLLVAIGVALFARLISPKIGPAAKVALAYAGTWVLFAFGRAYERKLRDFARPVMAGALALGFFVSYSSHFIPPMKFLPLSISLIWMSASVLLILVFAEFWKSQPTAGLAIFLGHASAVVAAGNANSFSLIVIVFLSVTAVVLFVRHNWLPLSLFAVVAAYFTHMLWVTVQRTETPPLQAFWINLSFLSSYYVIFLAADTIWWRRLKEKSETAFSEGQRITGKIFGPANLVLYISLATFFYIATKIYAEEIHWFFFILAGVQAIVGFIHRRFDDADHYFYPAVGVVLVTIGLFSAFNALTLNLVLAAEAIILLITAHRTRIWLFHLLAQLALILNFFHYWFYTRGEPSTLSYFIGGLMTAGVYFLKSSLEELWYGTGNHMEWRGGGRSSFSQALIQEFDRIFPKVAPSLAYVHAAAGAVILVNQCTRHFSTPTAVAILSVFSVVFVLASVFGKNAPLMAGYLSFIISFMYYLEATFLSQFLLSPLLSYVSAASSVIAALLLVLLAPKGMPSEKILSSLCFGSLAIWAGIAMIGISVWGSNSQQIFYLPWILLIALLYLAMDREVAAIKELGTGRSGLSSTPSSINTVASIAASILLIFVTWAFHEMQSSLPAWLVWWSILLIAAAGLRGNATFYASGIILLLACYLFLLHSPLARKVMDNAAVSLWIGILTVGIAWTQDLLLIKGAGNRVRPRTRSIAQIITWLIYLLGLFFLFQFVQYRISFPWSVTIISLCSLALFSFTKPLKMRSGPLVSFLLVLAVQGLALLKILELQSIPRNMLLAGAIFFAEGLAFERLITIFKPLLVPLVFDNAFAGNPNDPPANSYYDISYIARSVVIAAATVVAVFTIYYSTAFGAKWTTAGWSIIGVLLVILGFLWKSSIYRRTALALFALCLLRVFLVDTRNLSDAYKTAAFIILGLCLIGMAWLYSRFSSEIRKWL